FLKPLGKAARSLAELEKEAAKLPGKVSFCVARLGSRSPAALAAVNPDEALGIGSAFKLWVLGQLVEDVAQGKRKWTDVTPLAAARRSLPSGMLQGWPDGSPVTLHTLASLMISISDNTATDHLVALLGREKIERHLAVMGAVTSPRRVPLLMTSDMFRLKWGTRKDAAKRFIEGDLVGKRAVLAEIDRDPLPEVGAITPEPKLIAELEWFASANDLVRTLDWLRAATARDETARGALSINNGGVDANGWRWIGFKGGSEPGVLELAWLLERSDGAWFTVCIGANDPSGEVSSAKVGSIAQRAIELLATTKPAKEY
ncbi:MAG: serine hydrolase, partial [Planctomycetota bacterium]